MAKVKVIRVGTAAAIIFPDEATRRAGVQAGDALLAVAHPGGALLTSLPLDVQEHVEAGRRMMDRYRETMKQLAL